MGANPLQSKGAFAITPQTGGGDAFLAAERQL